MPENLLTDAKVRSAKPTDRDWKLSDGGGLFLLVKPTGGKLWRWKYRLQGKENLFAISSFPQVSLAKVRAAREKARTLVKQGIHPAHGRQQIKQRNLEALEERKRAKESSFAKVAKAYLAEIKPVFALSSYRTKESRIRKYLSPKFDGMPMSDISVKQIRPLLQECKAHGAWAAIHVKGDLSAIFEFAVVRGLVEANPIPSLRGLLRVPFSESKAAMTREQIQKFYRELRGYRGYPETSLCLRLIALTACRPGEAADAEWDEFDFEDALWRRPAAKMKARRDHVNLLSVQAIAVLKDLPCITGGGRYLFPHRSGKGFTTPNRLTYAMRDMNLDRGTTPHCWRTTFSTWANENGYRPVQSSGSLPMWKATRCGRRTTRRCCWIREGRCCRTGRTIRVRRGTAARHREELAGCCRTNGQGGLFLCWIGPLSLECRSFAVCFCRRLGSENEANNGINGVTTHSIPLFAIGQAGSQQEWQWVQKRFERLHPHR